MKKDSMKILAKNLKSAIQRVHGDISGAEFARRCDVSQKTISNILSANRPADLVPTPLPSPSIETIEKIGAALNMEPWELLHPDLDRVRREHEFYIQAASTFQGDGKK
jgi:transcriptional regulator with XRE-family HTH domain